MSWIDYVALFFGFSRRQAMELLGLYGEDLLRLGRLLGRMPPERAAAVAARTGLSVAEIEAMTLKRYAAERALWPKQSHG